MQCIFDVSTRRRVVRILWNARAGLDAQEINLHGTRLSRLHACWQRCLHWLPSDGLPKLGKNSVASCTPTSLWSARSTAEHPCMGDIPSLQLTNLRRAGLKREQASDLLAVNRICFRDTHAGSTSQSAAELCQAGLNSHATAADHAAAISVKAAAKSCRARLQCCFAPICRAPLSGMHAASSAASPGLGCWAAASPSWQLLGALLLPGARSSLRRSMLRCATISLQLLLASSSGLARLVALAPCAGRPSTLAGLSAQDTSFTTAWSCTLLVAASCGCLTGEQPCMCACIHASSISDTLIQHTTVH